MKVTRLRCEHRRDPIGIGARMPRVSWDVGGGEQVAYRITGDNGWDTGFVTSSSSTLIDYSGPSLGSDQRVTWHVTVRDASGDEVTSDAAQWEMGLLDPGDWWSSWIGPPASWSGGAATPTPRFRRTFDLPAPAVRARLHITALGLYEAHCNGERIGDERFTPGWTDYFHRVQHQTYDVTELVREGGNVLDVELADGWYAGWLGWLGARELYGSEPQLRAQLVVEHDAGATMVGTDRSWVVAAGPRREADLLMGETYDARIEPDGWEPARVTAGTTAAIVAPVAPPTRVIEERSPVSVTDRGDVRIVDFGQNLVGWARLTTRGPSGTKVTIRFAEMLDGDGSLYVDNLRSARATDTYVCAGTGEEVWEPSFTFHGFRYAEITGPGELVAVVCHADLEPTGSFRCSDERVNQLQSNIVWGMRGNFLEVPTDCPQRDERLGWMGDAQVFAPTACFNVDVAAFFTKWMTDVIDGQTAEGGFPDVAPRIIDPQDGAPGWGDAGVIVPWTVYVRYGDRRLLERCYPAMAAWVDYIEKANPGLRWLERRNGDMGDWLSIDADSPKDVVATSFFAHSAAIVAKAATVLGRDHDAHRYDELAAGIREAYVAAYVDADGRIHGDTQCVYSLALRFELLPDALRPLAAQHLADDVIGRGHHLSTGFLGVAHLLPALTEHGHADVAYRLLHQDTFPSWLYPVEHGATTIWERWDGWTADRGFQDPGMNSFNHYAFGAVGEWLYEHVAGIKPVPARPGYRHVVIEPHIGGELLWVEAEHRGIEVAWRRDLDAASVEVDVTIPNGSTAELRLPGRPPIELGPGRHVDKCEI